MSLIADALKTAQREKQRHTAGDHALSVPVLVPLRARETTSFNWRRTVGIGVTSAVLIGAGVVALQRWRSASPILPDRATVIPEASVPVPPASGRSTSSAVARRPRAAAPAIHHDLVRARVSGPVAAPLTPAPPPQIAAQMTRSTTSGQATRVRSADTPAVQQAAAQPRDAAAVPSGRLRIAVDQPRDAEVARLFAIGVAAHRNGDLAGARSAYEAVLTLAPSDVDALNNLALVLLADGDAARAEVLLRRALSLAPRNGGAWNNLGAVLRVRGRTNEAVAAFQHALNIDPQNQAARISLAQQFVAIGSLDQARVLLVESVAADPNAAEAQYTLGQVLELQGDVAGAVHAYREFIRVAPLRLAANVERVKLHLDTLEARR